MKSDWITLYKEGLTLQEIANRAGVSSMTVMRELKKHNVTLRPTGRRVLFPTERKCSRCKQIKPINDFHKSRRVGNGQGYICKPCAIEKNYTYNLRKKYNLSQKQFDDLLNKQNGACAICNEKSNSKLHIDHSHRTGKVRGLLCRRCNTTLGLVEENPQILQKMQEYLQ